MIKDTPRTDNAIFTHYDEMCDDEFTYVLPSFARKLEREVETLKDEIEGMHEDAAGADI
jgi:hypothetical protein|tara:strand:+ start:127 stop:303 length:177 start_codon:yes stop_codon:yes gene_type:complete